MHPAFHSVLRRGISLWAVFRPSLTPVRSFTVTGISPRALFMPIKILPNFPGVSSTKEYMSMQKEILSYDAHAEPLPVRKTRSIGQPQLMSTKSMFPAHSLAMISAVGTRVEGLFPATWTPNIDSEGCRLTKDHSSFDPPRNEVASPTTISFKVVFCS